MLVLAERGREAEPLQKELGGRSAVSCVLDVEGLAVRTTHESLALAVGRRATTRVPEGWAATPASGRWLWALSTRLGPTLPPSSRTDGVATLGAGFLLNPFSQVSAASSAPGGAGAARFRVVRFFRPFLQADAH